MANITNDVRNWCVERNRNGSTNNNDAVDSGANEAEQTGSVSNEEIEQELLQEEQIPETEQVAAASR